MNSDSDYVTYEVRTNTDGERGLFAVVDFRQGETVVRLPEITQPDPDKFSVEAWPGIHLNCSESPVGALNHACAPNCAVFNGKIVAWRCITAGEELTINYKLTETELAAPFDCLCGAKKCRGRIE